MHIPQIEINQYPAKLAIHTKRPGIDIRQKNNELKLEKVNGKLEINRENAFMKIDYYPSRYDLGIKNLHDFTGDNYRKNKAEVLEYIGEYAREGNQLMEYQKGITVAEIAREKNFREENKELVLKSLSPPDIEVEAGKLDIKHSPGKVKVGKQDFPPVRVILNRGEVRIKLARKTRIEISFKTRESNFTGQHVNSLA